MRGYILITFVLSTIACIITFFSLASEEWVVSNPKWSLPEITTINDVHYGLFSGTLNRNLGGIRSVHIISMTCDFGEDACAMLCGTETERVEKLDKLIKRENVSFNPSCGSNSRMFEPSPKIVPTSREAPEPIFINASFWLSSIAFLVLTGILGVVTIVLSLWNVIGNPVNPFHNSFGLQMYNSLAAITASLVLGLWIIHFERTLTNNVAVLETITGQMVSEERTSLGYSYWIIWLSWSFYIINAFFIYRAKKHQVDNLIYS